jgi:hypothetical protein
MKDFAYVTESQSGKHAAINPEQVREIIDLDGKRVAVIFDSHHQIIVDGTVATVSNHIRKSFG